VVGQQLDAVVGLAGALGDHVVDAGGPVDPLPVVAVRLDTLVPGDLAERIDQAVARALEAVELVA
jgi:hypothetical protein